MRLSCNNASAGRPLSLAEGLATVKKAWCLPWDLDSSGRVKSAGRLAIVQVLCRQWTWAVGLARRLRYDRRHVSSIPFSSISDGCSPWFQLRHRPVAGDGRVGLSAGSGAVYLQLRWGRGLFLQRSGRLRQLSHHAGALRRLGAIEPSAVAGCNDCHLPHDFLGKWWTKADNGLFQSWASPTGDFHEPTQITPRNRRVTQGACIHCHRDFVHNLLPLEPGGDMLDCIHCHQAVGHSQR